MDRKHKKLTALLLACMMLFITACVVRPKGPPDEPVEPSDDPVIVKVGFDLNYQGAPANPETVSVTVGEPYGALPRPAREDSFLTGWYFNAECSGAKVSASAKVTRTEDHTLYAGWSETPIPAEELYEIPSYPNNVVMNIGASFPYLNKLQDYADYADAGFTYIEPHYADVSFGVSTSGDKQALDMLNYADIYGLKVLVADSKILNYYDGDPWALLANPGIVGPTTFDSSNAYKYESHPAFMGNMIFDEPVPPTSKTGWINNKFGWVKAKNAAYKNYFGADKEFFFNLLPSTPQGGSYDTSFLGMTWENYLKGFLDMGLPQLSYDNYVLLKPSLSPAVGGGKYPNPAAPIKESFFSDLETARTIAKQYGVPLNNYILSASHEAGSRNLYRVPTEAEIRWQVAVDLAYGVRSFTYYAYRQITGYDSALVAINGAKQPTYYHAQTVNNEVLAWDHVYLRFEWDKTLAVGNNFLFTPPTNHPNLANRYLSGVAAGVAPGIKKLTCGGESLLAGIFKDKSGRNGYMLTAATEPSFGRNVTASVEFDGYDGVLVYDKGQPVILNLDSNGGAEITLEPGEGKFLIPLLLKQQG